MVLSPWGSQHKTVPRLGRLEDSEDGLVATEGHSQRPKFMDDVAGLSAGTVPAEGGCLNSGVFRVDCS